MVGIVELRELKLYGLFKVHINHSGLYWDNHVFDLLVLPCLEMTFYQRLQGSFMYHWGSRCKVVVKVPEIMEGGMSGESAEKSQ